MTKKKVKKSVSKRFKVTKTGKVLFERQHSKGHLQRHKSRRRQRRLREPGMLEGKFAQKVKKMLGHL